MRLFYKHLIFYILAGITLSVQAQIDQSQKDSDESKGDIFQQIAKTRHNEVPGLKSNPIPVFDKVILPMDQNPERQFIPVNKIDTKEELASELQRMKSEYAIFMKNHAPDVVQSKRLDLVEFDWRIAQYYEKENPQFAINGLGRWDKVSIPHYSGPSGNATSYYRIEFDLSETYLNQEALFLHFQGVDYYAAIYFNGQFIGEHEGMFDAFEFNIKDFVRKEDNVLLVQVRNEGCPIGTTPPYQAYQWAPNFHFGTKLAAYGGPGWDDPWLGWNCTPIGFGLWQDVWIEGRNKTHIHDIFVQPNLQNNSVEVWVEINTTLNTDQLHLFCSIYGQNFESTIIENYEVPFNFDDSYPPQFLYPNKIDSTPGLVSSTQFRLAKFVVSMPVDKIKYWSPEEPWLYQIQLSLVNKINKQVENEVLDQQKQQFGFRSFVQSHNSIPKGRFYLNGNEVRLRGANMMGNIMQCVMRKDTNQLIEDILLAKIAHNNFWRMTQQPCQPMAYEFFDKLGLMAQSDMPAFHYIPALKRNEYLRQAGALMKMIRKHPCNAVLSYMNEPMKGTRDPNIQRLTEDQQVALFHSCDSLSSIVNPGQVIKWIDGDYQNLSKGYSDHHCYNLWYWKHTVVFSKMYQGQWCKTRAGWMHGCGEFGTEGLCDTTFMRKHYLAEWLPNSEEELWTPARIPGCQSARPAFRRWIGEPITWQEWVENSQRHQAFSTRLIVEALRRDAKMNSTAIHLLIDAWPNGWLKSIMDSDRQPKPAYFAFRDAQTPLAANLKPTSFYAFSDDTIFIEAWNCNDLDTNISDYIVKYHVEMGNLIIHSGKANARIDSCEPMYQGDINFIAPKVRKKTTLIVRYAIFSNKGHYVHDTMVEIEIYPNTDRNKQLNQPGGYWQYLIES